MARSVRAGRRLVGIATIVVPLLGSACGPKTEAPDALCGTAMVLAEQSCGNGRTDAGELCLTSETVPREGGSGYFHVLDVDGDDVLDLLTSGAPHRLWRGRGDGSFRTREAPLIDGEAFVDAPEGMPYDFLAGSSDDDRIRLIGYTAEEDGTFTPTYLHSGPALETVVTSLGAGRVDPDGENRVYLGIEHVETSRFTTHRYSVRGSSASALSQSAPALGQPGLAPTEADGIWIGDFDADGYEDDLVSWPQYELQQFDGTTWVTRVIDSTGGFFNNLRWLVDTGAAACETLGALNLVQPLYVQAHRVDDEMPEEEVWEGLAVARINADDALDLLFAKDDGTYVALGSLAEPAEPLQPDPDATDWPDVDVRDHPFLQIEKISDAVWGDAMVIDLDADGTPDLVGAYEAELEIMLGGR